MHMLVLETHRLSFNTGIIMITNSRFVHDTCQLPTQFRHAPDGDSSGGFLGPWGTRFQEPELSGWGRALNEGTCMDGRGEGKPCQ